MYTRTGRSSLPAAQASDVDVDDEVDAPEDDVTCGRGDRRAAARWRCAVPNRGTPRADVACEAPTGADATRQAVDIAPGRAGATGKCGFKSSPWCFSSPTGRSQNRSRDGHKQAKSRAKSEMCAISSWRERRSDNLPISGRGVSSEAPWQTPRARDRGRRGGGFRL